MNVLLLACNAQQERPPAKLTFHPSLNRAACRGEGLTHCRVNSESPRCCVQSIRNIYICDPSLNFPGQRLLLSGRIANALSIHVSSKRLLILILCNVRNCDHLFQIHGKGECEVRSEICITEYVT